MAQFEPVQDILGLGRLAQQIRLNRQEAQQAPIRELQKELLQGKVEQQRGTLADIARQRQNQADLQTAIQQNPEMDVDKVSLDFFKQRDPAKAQQFEQMIFGRATELSKSDPQGASDFLKQKTGQQFDFSVARKKSEIAAQKNRFQQAKDIRSEIAKASKTFDDTTDAFGRIKAVSKTPSAAGDLALIFNFMKMLDPGSVVRESEFKTAEQARAWLSEAENAGVRVPAAIVQGIQKLSTGQKLLPEQRADFISQAGSIFTELEGRHGQTVESFINLANRFGLEREDVIVEKGRIEPEPQPETTEVADQTIIISGHPVHGDITEEDLAVSMKNNNLTREEVLQRLEFNRGPR